MLTESNRTPHERSWFYVGLMFALAPVGTHPLDNPRLLAGTNGVHGLSSMLDHLVAIAVVVGFNGGTS